MSIDIERNVPLAPLTTLKVGGHASHFVRVSNETELNEAVAYGEEHRLPLVILGGGSNVVVRERGVDALVLAPQFVDVSYAHGEDHTVMVTAGAGVVLDALVRETVERGLWGLENLSHIPGSVGAVPIQNVGAYGVEAKDVVVSVRAYDMLLRASVTLSREECQFDYRTSFFKSEEGKRFIITHVTFSLSSLPQPRISYKDLASRFQDLSAITQHAVRDAVIAIRSQKFPDWHTVGTAGSFFKNPIIEEEVFTVLKERYPGIPGFPHRGKVKVSLGWILDHVLHLKGYREGNVGLYEAQALVLVTYGETTGEDIVAFSDGVIRKIFDATHIIVEREVVVL